ncbi:hypothetical protein P5673_009885 [Acropora cervicornis]|uniref:Uncharacterized protein n=1 Tax=Acropora cervicornis TaxID=6130 RepID=A0AAD9QS52_ACRCE|nr:hypothetical protein P5673_009885 [Acropora cervicornis]
MVYTKTLCFRREVNDWELLDTYFIRKRCVFDERRTTGIEAMNRNIEFIPADPAELSQWLKKSKKLRSDTCDILKANKVEGKTLIRLTRSNLTDLIPGDFLARKELWDLVEYLQNSSFKIVEKQDELAIEEDNEFDFRRTQCSPPALVRKERSKSPSTLSVDSDQSDRSFGFDIDTPRPSTPIFPKSESHKWASFTFPLPPGLKSHKEVPDNLRKQIIRDAYTCMRAQAQNDKINSQDFTIVAKQICKAVPQLKDHPPPGNRCSLGDFEYWGTVRYLLRKRHTNLKRPVDNDCKEEMERKKKCVDSLRPTPADIANHHKQIMIELRKVDVNVDAVRKLQKLSFLQRADDISNIHGTDALTKILKNYPFLQLEEQLLYELELHVQRILGKEVRFEDIKENWKKLMPTLCKAETTKDDMPALAMSQISDYFEKCPPLLTFVDKVSGDIDEFIKKETTSNSPTLLAFDLVDEKQSEKDSSQLFLVIDKSVFLEVTDETNIDYSKGLYLLLAVYYALNLQYDTKQKLLFQFLEEYVLEVKPLRRTFKYRQICNKIFQQVDDVTA